MNYWSRKWRTGQYGRGFGYTEQVRVAALLPCFHTYADACRVLLPLEQRDAARTAQDDLRHPEHVAAYRAQVARWRA